MALGCLSRRRRAELRADFRRFYGLEFDGYARAHPAIAADLAAMLPRESATVRAECPDAAWGDAEWLLAGIEYAVCAVGYGLGVMKSKPKMLRPGGRPASVTAADMEAVARSLGISAPKD